MPEDQALEYIESIERAEERCIRLIVKEILDSVNENQENTSNEPPPT